MYRYRYRYIDRYRYFVRAGPKLAWCRVAVRFSPPASGALGRNRSRSPREVQARRRRGRARLTSSASGHATTSGEAFSKRAIATVAWVTGNGLDVAEVLVASLATATSLATAGSNGVALVTHPYQRRLVLTPIIGACVSHFEIAAGGRIIRHYARRMASSTTRLSFAGCSTAAFHYFAVVAEAAAIDALVG